jgi:hypothetical protein
MRGNHGEYIAMCNAQTGIWYEPVKRGRVRSTVPMVYYLPDGRYEIPAGTVSDLFSVVPDTGYIEFHKSAFLHDYQRGAGHGVARERADYNFSWDMTQRIQHIRRALIACECPRPVLDREAIRLTRLAAMYSLGVSGLIGSAYIAMDKWF